MNNIAATSLDDAQWAHIWRAFQTSGIVLVSTSFQDTNMPTEGFAEASQDFQACLEQLDLIGNSFEEQLSRDRKFQTR
jgi:hypothetical protein